MFNKANAIFKNNIFSKTHQNGSQMTLVKIILNTHSLLTFFLYVPVS